MSEPSSTSGPTPAARSAHPAVAAMLEQRAGDVQLRLADAITRFAGSMTFVYIHIVVFAAWMLVIENNPWPTLTLVVSLEAIFLSTFVMIGQNRQAAFAQVKADHEFVEQEQALKANTELTRRIAEIVVEVQHRIAADQAQRDERPGGTGEQRP